MHQFQGEGARGADTLWRFVQEQAAQEDARIASAIAASKEAAFPTCTAVEDVYATASEEFVVYTDGIGVKAQKPTRQKAGQTRVEKTKKRHETDVLLLPRPDGGHVFVCEGVSGVWSLVQAARAFLCRCFAGVSLAVVAISDGARAIREDLHVLFGEGVRILLDWYHLSKRVYENLSMAAPSKIERKHWEQTVLGFLWRGQVEEALTFLSSVTPRNAEALADLIGYVQKHQDESIDYQRRQQADKPIDSGQTEKAVDQVVGMRQKKRA
jgi:hypothetical protein